MLLKPKDVGATAEGNTKGTYSITGNTMRINFDDGEKIVVVITVFGKDGERNFWFLITVLFRRKNKIVFIFIQIPFKKIHTYAAFGQSAGGYHH